MSEITRRPVARSRRDGKNVGRISPAKRITMKQINEFQVGRINSNEPLFYAVKPLKKENVVRFVKQLGERSWKLSGNARFYFIEIFDATEFFEGCRGSYGILYFGRWRHANRVLLDEREIGRERRWQSWDELGRKGGWVALYRRLPLYLSRHFKLNFLHPR